MPITARKPEDKRQVRLIAKVKQKTHRTLQQLAASIDEDISYVIDQLVDQEQTSNRTFREWREQQAKQDPAQTTSPAGEKAKSTNTGKGAAA